MEAVPPLSLSATETKPWKNKLGLKEVKKAIECNITLRSLSDKDGNTQLVTCCMLHGRSSRSQGDILGGERWPGDTPRQDHGAQESFPLESG